MAFAKALVVSRTLRSVATLPHSHGLKDVSPPHGRLMDLSIRIDARGTFQEFNEVIAPMTRLNYHDENAMPQALALPSAPSARLEGLELTLKDILSRIPGLEQLYQNTFREPANTEAFSLHASPRDHTYWELRIDDAALFVDRATLVTLIENWRLRFPLLAKWRVVSATRAWGKAIVVFANVARPGNELDDSLLEEDATQFLTTDDPLGDSAQPRLPLHAILSSVGGSSTRSASFISPFRAVYLSEYALHYLGMFLLSTLVRYRPQTWVHAISRTATTTAPPDDQALALLEQFMGIHSAAIPMFVADVLDPQST
jgi:hypothetical protein